MDPARVEFRGKIAYGDRRCLSAVLDPSYLDRLVSIISKGDGAKAAEQEERKRGGRGT